MTEEPRPKSATRRRRKHYYPTTTSGEVVTEPAPVRGAAATGTSPVAEGPVGAPDAGEPEVPAVAEDGESIVADKVQVTRAAVGRVEAGEIEVERGIARTVLAREVELEQAFARTVIAADVRAERSFIGVLVARHLGGDVRVLLDWRGAAVFAVIAGVLGGLISRAGRRGKA